MKTTFPKTLFSLALAATAFFGAAGLAGATSGVQPAYTLTDLGTLGGPGSQAFSLNGPDQIVGYANITPGDSSTYHAFYYDTSMHDLGTLGGPYNFAYSINSSKQIAGSAEYNSNNTHAVRYDASNLANITRTDLGSLGGPNSGGVAISGTGEVVGTSDTAGQASSLAFLYDTSLHNLGTLPGGTFSEAFGINNSHQVVGDSDSGTSNGNTVACRFDATHPAAVTVTALGSGTLGGSNGTAYAINAANQIVGSAYITGDSASHAFYFDTSMHDLGTLGGTTSYAFAINSASVMVGYSRTTSNGLHAWVQHGLGGTMTDLNSLIAPGSSLTLTTARGIDDAGDIVGTGVSSGGVAHAYLLTPITTPPAPNTPDLQAASDSGASNTDNKTTNTSPTFDIGGVVSGDTVNLLRNGIVVRSAVSSSTSISLQDSGPLTAGNSYTYTATQANGSSPSPASSGLTVTIIAAPVAVADTYALGAGQMVTTTAAQGVLHNDTDADSGGLTATLATGPAHAAGTFTLNSNGSFSYTQAAGYTGPDSFTYKAVDGTGTTADTSNTVTVTLTVPAAPNAPDLQAASDTGISSTDNKTANTSPTFDIGGVTAGDTVNLLRDGTIVRSAVSSGTTISLQDPGPVGLGQHTYTATQTSGATGAASSGLSVTIINPPVANPDTFGQASNGTASGNVLSNDTDSDGGALTASLVSGPAHAAGTFTLNSDGSFTYTQTAGSFAADSFTYKAVDGTDTSNTTTVTLSAPPVPAAPSAPVLQAASDSGFSNSDDKTTNTSPTFTISGVTSGDTVNLLRDGAVVNSVVSTGTSVSLQDPGPVALGQHTYTATQTNGPTSSASPGLTVTTIAAPVANADTYAFAASPTITGNVLANDTDSDGGTLTATLVTGPTNDPGFTLNADGSFTYTRAAGTSGPDSFTYKAVDGTGATADNSNTVTVSLTVPPSLSHTYVSNTGVDAGSCSRSAPCATFAYALTKTLPGGTITALNAGEYGPVTITQAVTIDGSGTQANITVASGNGITVNAASTDTVVLRGLSVTSLPGDTGPTAAVVQGGGALVIDDCHLSGFSDTGGGAGLRRRSSGTTLVQNTTVADCFDGIEAIKASGLVSLRNVTLQGNLLGVLASGAGMQVDVKDSQVTQSSAVGLEAVNGATLSASGCALSGNGTAVLSGLNAIVRLTNNDIFNNHTALDTSQGGIVSTTGNNRRAGNATTTAPLAPTDQPNREIAVQ